MAGGPSPDPDWLTRCMHKISSSPAEARTIIATTLTGGGDAPGSVEYAAKGWGALLAKVDVKNAYRNAPINPDDRWLMGML